MYGGMYYGQGFYAYSFYTQVTLLLAYFEKYSSPGTVYTPKYR